MPAKVLYLHGFNSSPLSQKATEVRHFLERHHPQVELVVPDLGNDPAEALERALVEATGCGTALMGIIGSSMGGFFAAILSQRLGLPAVLINPAVYPHRLLKHYLGPQVNPYTGERYELLQEHVAVLEAMDPQSLQAPERIFVLVQTGDETLDYRQAVERFAGCRFWIQPGGDHSFQAFSQRLPAIFAFLQSAVHSV